MANALYAKGKQAILTGSIDFTSATIKVALLDGADYTPNLSTHDFLDDVAGAAIVGTAQTLAGKSVTDGVFDADDVTFTAVSGDQFEYLLLYKDTGASATSPLIALWDTATGLAFTPSGSDIILTWSNGASKIFAL